MKRLKLFLIALASVALTPQSLAQTPTAELAQPPADAETWAIMSTAGRHGQSQRWITPDGARWSRESILLRGFVTEIDQHLHIDADGSLASLVVRGVTPSGDAAESFSIANGRYQYRSPVDSGGENLPAGAFYTSYGGAIDATIALADALHAAPNHTLRLLPRGQAQLIELTTHQVSTGQETKTLTAYGIVGLGFSPLPVWYDGDHFFASVNFLSYVPLGWESVVDELTQAQDAALARRGGELVTSIGPRLTQPILFQDVRLYDADNRRFRAHMSVVVTEGRVTAVGRASSIRAPADARIIPGAGRTLIPGLWDNHQHLIGDDAGAFLLAQGITSIRDPANRPDIIARRRRIEAGEVLGPRIVPSMLIDGEGPYSAQMAVLAHDLAEARAAVRRARDSGFFAVKLYGTLDQALVAPIAEEAHRLGLHVHGHIPHGMRPLDAVRAGYDEITHINMAMMQAMPDEVVRQSNGLQRFYGPARYAPDVDLRSPEMRTYLNELQRRHIAVDPTLVVFEVLYVPDPGEVAAAYAPFVGTTPSQIERSFRSGGIAATPEVSRDQMRRAQVALSALVGELHRRGIPIIAGTDGNGLELVRELELYVAAGLTPADALATATIVPSRLFRVGDETGSITVGKRAELVLVEGDPSRDIGDLRNVLMVMRDGRLMQANDLRAAVGISGPPRQVR